MPSGGGGPVPSCLPDDAGDTLGEAALGIVLCGNLDVHGSGLPELVFFLVCEAVDEDFSRRLCGIARR